MLSPLVFLPFFALDLTLAARTPHAEQPFFPNDCDLPLTGKPEYRYVDRSGAFVKGTFEIRYCYKLGTPCETNTDCPTPSQAECSANAQGPIPPSYIQAYGLRRGTCIDNFCRNADPFKDGQYAGESCNCLQGCFFKAGRDDIRDNSCVADMCVPNECAECGEPANNRQCCGSGHADKNGICKCFSGVGEGCGTDPSKCDNEMFSDVCCGKGTSNEGECCAQGSCNGQCVHQPKIRSV